MLEKTRKTGSHFFCTALYLEQETTTILIDQVAFLSHGLKTGAHTTVAIQRYEKGYKMTEFYHYMTKVYSRLQVKKLNWLPTSRCINLFEIYSLAIYVRKGENGKLGIDLCNFLQPLQTGTTWLQRIHVAIITNQIYLRHTNYSNILPFLHSDGLDKSGLLTII